MADMDMVLKLCPGTKKMNLHASYAIFDEENGGWVDRDKLEPKHFKKWVDFCKERGLGCDFNPTFFSHPKCDPLTLASPDEKTRNFWIEHGKACIRISPVSGRGAGTALRHEHLDGRRLQGYSRRPHGPPTAVTRNPWTRSCPSRLTSTWSSPAWSPRCSASAWKPTPWARAEFALSYAAMNHG